MCCLVQGITWWARYQVLWQNDAFVSIIANESAESTTPAKCRRCAFLFLYQFRQQPEHVELLVTFSNLQNVVTKLGFDWPLHRTDFTIENGFVKFLNHLSGTKTAKVAATLLA